MPEAITLLNAAYALECPENVSQDKRLSIANKLVDKAKLIRALPAPSKAAAEPVNAAPDITCVRCGGAGDFEVRVPMTQDDTASVTCPDCNATGAIAAPLAEQRGDEATDKALMGLALEALIWEQGGEPLSSVTHEAIQRLKARLDTSTPTGQLRADGVADRQAVAQLHRLVSKGFAPPLDLCAKVCSIAQQREIDLNVMIQSAAPASPAAAKAQE